MGLESMLHKVPEGLREKYLTDLPNINFLRTKAMVEGKEAASNAKANGHLFTREMRPVEVEMVEYLVPDARPKEGMETDPTVRLKAWKWVLKQDWGRELSGLPMEKRFH